MRVPAADRRVPRLKEEASAKEGFFVRPSCLPSERAGARCAARAVQPQPRHAARRARQSAAWLAEMQRKAGAGAAARGAVAQRVPPSQNARSEGGEECRKRAAAF